MNEVNNSNLWPCPKNGCPIILSIATSIAHAEDALACILNTECGKINKVVQSCSNIEDLIAIDTSVQVTLDKITVLEGVLKAKLDAIIPLLVDCI